ncbi:MAG: hypothetical protein LBQ69_05165 [Treponema sp.]|jgi:hypothetical protein|nr:hypothetical protein [Treponema sp.]
MKHFFFAAALAVPIVLLSAQNAAPKQPLFTWDLLLTGSWEESKTLHNRGDAHIGFTKPALILRAQALDRRPLNFELEQPWGDSANKAATASFGLYHKPTGSRLLYGILDEWGLPARIRSPWIRSAPYAENRKPIMADLRTTVATTKVPEAYLYLSSPRIELFRNGPAPKMALPVSLRGFASAQFPVEWDLAPSFSAGLDASLGEKYALMLEGFYTSAELPARQSSSWFSDPPPLPARDFRLGAASLMFAMPYVSLSSDWAWSETFAYGSGVYGNLGIRLDLPRSWAEAGTAKPGPWSVSLAADGMTDRYVGRDGASPAGGLRTAGKVEWKGPRSSLFRANTLLRSPGLEEPFDRSSTGLYYRFPALSARAGIGKAFPLRLSRASLSADRNASDLGKISDGIDAALGLSLGLPPMQFPAVFLPRTAAKNPKPKSYPLGINLSTSVDFLGSGEEVPSPYPFFPPSQEFDSAKASCEFIWSPGIFQFRNRWGYTAYAKKDDQWDASFSAAVRFSHGRFGVKIAFPVFPDKWNCTLSWRFEK